MAEEMLAELRRLRPEWLRAYPTMRSRSGHLKHRKATVWDELRKDPWYLPPTRDHVEAAVHSVIGENREAQRFHRLAVLEGRPVAFRGIPSRPDLTTLIHTYREDERYVRNGLMVHWTAGDGVGGGRLARPAPRRGRDGAGDGRTVARLLVPRGGPLPHAHLRPLDPPGEAAALASGPQIRLPASPRPSP